MSKPLVSICCLAYNHEAYIKKCLDGFLMQKTDFKFEILIHDDASTDQTANIIRAYERDYPDIVKPIYQSENQYSKGIRVTPKYNISRAEGKYIAMCEGDDYWTDPSKLQKQVDFLESHDDYVVSWTNYKTFNGKDVIDNHFNFSESLRTIDFNTIFRPYCTLTLTVVFKKSALELSQIEKFKFFKDNTLYALLLKNGKGIFMDFETAVYRQHEGGVYALKSHYYKNYSSYINIKEIIDFIPEANTKNMQKVLNSLGNATAFGLLKLKQEGETISEDQLNFMNDYFKHANLKTKFKYFKRRFLK